MQENQISHVFFTFLLLTEEDMASCSRAKMTVTSQLADGPTRQRQLADV